LSDLLKTATKTKRIKKWQHLFHEHLVVQKAGFFERLVLIAASLVDEPESQFWCAF
jgi:hypothetical protein